MPRFDHRAVPIVLVAIMIDAIGFGIVMPVLPGLVMTLGHVGLDSATRIGGWMLAVFAIGQFVAAPVIGTLGDAYGRRMVLIASMAAFAADYALMAAAPTRAWLFVGRAIAGVAGATIGPAGAVIADVTPPERRAAAFGLVGAAFGIGFILGPALGGLAAAIGSRAPFVIAAGMAATNALIMLMALPETLPHERRRRFRLRDAHVLEAFRPLFHAGNAAPLLVATFLWQLGGVVYPTTWAYWATAQFGWDATAIGWSLAYVGLLSVIVQMGVTARVIAALGERGAAIVGLACAAATMIAYAFATHGWQVYAFFLIGAFGALAYPAINGTLSRLVDETRQGALQGGIASLSSLAAIIGPPVAAQAFAEGTARGFDGAAFLVAGGLMTAATLVIALFVPRLASTA